MYFRDLPKELRRSEAKLVFEGAVEMLVSTVSDVPPPPATVLPSHVPPPPPPPPELEYVAI